MHDIKPITPVATLPNAQATHLPPQKPVHKNDNTFIYLTLAILVMAILGTASGWGIYTVSANLPTTPTEKKVEATPIAQTETPTDAPDAEGLVVSDNTEGMGSHKIGEIYILSSLLDLESFEGKKVKVWGSKITTDDDTKTLLDVGRIKEL